MRERQLTFEPFAKRIDHSIRLMQKYESKALELSPDGFQLGFSGGKDSVVLYDIAVKAGVKFKPVYNKTTVDPPEVLNFIKKHYPDVVWERPERSMWKLIETEMTLPIRQARYCCRFLKEYSGKNHIVAVGIRAEESRGRTERGWFYRHRPIKHNKWIFSPIFWWNEADVWEYIDENNLPYLSLYDEGFSRVGCVGCPMAGKHRVKEFERWPNFRRAYIRAFEKMLVARKKADKENKKNWKTGEDVMNWWMEE